MHRNLIVFLLLVLMTCNLHAQRYGKNLPNFEHRKLYFGTHLGVNTTSFRLGIKPNAMDYDSLVNLSVSSGPGIGIHIPMISYAPIHLINIRFLMSISFHEATFNYQRVKHGTTETKSFRFDGTNLNFPLFLKLNTKRIDNFSAYAVSGFSYSYNLANDEDVDQSLSEPILKLKKHDYAYHVGGGFEFYKKYFKLGVEIRLSNGVNNLLIQDQTFYSNPLSSVKSQIWWFSITFEG